MRFWVGCKVSPGWIKPTSSTRDKGVTTNNPSSISYICILHDRANENRVTDHNTMPEQRSTHPYHTSS